MREPTNQPSPNQSRPKQPSPNQPPGTPTPPVYTRRGRELDTDTEWLLTNALGGFASGSVAGVRTRRYHGLLVASTRPPVGRVMTLAEVGDAVRVRGAPDGQAVRLTRFHFRDQPLPSAPPTLVEFVRDGTCRWTHRVALASASVRVDRGLVLMHERNTGVLRYTLTREAEDDGREPIELELRPLLAIRDFHGLVRLNPDGSATADHGDPLPGHERPPPESGEHRVRWPERDGEAIEIETSGIVVRMHAHAEGVSIRFDREQSAWREVFYQRDHERGQDAAEDLFSPGTITIELPAGARTGAVELAFSAGQVGTALDEVPSFAELQAAEHHRLAALIDGAQLSAIPDARDRETLAALAVAADVYVVRRRALDAETSSAPDGTSIIAGYPWFSDWGRDTMIALPGLLLATGRLREAGRVLENFAAHRRDGIIPNHFDDRTDEPMYNTVDAPLWFIHACDAYAQAGAGDDDIQDRFRRTLLPACLDIARAYERGTAIPGRHSPGARIAMDPDDAMIAAGDERTQLTWMDAQRDGVTFTPRHGKPVEIQALWHHALHTLALRLQDTDPRESARLRARGERVGESLRTKFWNAQRSCLYDTLTPSGDERENGWMPIDAIRPNQVFAVSLGTSALTREQQIGVVRTVRAHLYTPFGLRTLAPGEPGYRARFRGPIFELDGAYHNGTAWPWLLPPFAIAWAHAHNNTAEARHDARELLKPLLTRLNASCPGAIPEVYDAEGDEKNPQNPGGCFAQAWSVATLLHAWRVLRA